MLVYLFPGLGDNVLLLPVLESLFEQEPSLVGVLARSAGKRVLARYGRKVRVHELPEILTDPTLKDATHRADDVAPRNRRAKQKAESALTLELEREGYDVAVDLTMRREVDARGWVRRSGAVDRVGLTLLGESAEEAGLVASVLDERHAPIQHWSRHIIAGLGPLGLREPRYEVPLSIPRRATVWARAAYGEKVSEADRTQGGGRPSTSATDRRRVLLVPGSKYSEKKWAIESWRSMAETLREDESTSYVITGAPFEAKAMRAFGKHLGAKVYTGADLGILMALVAEADLVIGNDTGPMHFAYLLGRPAITLFLHMSPTVWGPPRPSSNFVTLEGAPTEARVVAEARRILAGLKAG